MGTIRRSDRRGLVIDRQPEQQKPADLLDSCLVMPAAPDGGSWPVIRGPDGIPVVLLFTSVERLRAGQIGADDDPYSVWPVLDLLAWWPDPAWKLLIDPAQPGEVLMTPEVIAALAEQAIEAYPLDAALRAADGDAERYLDALVGAEVVVPIASGGSPSRDLADPDFAWWRTETADSARAVALFSSPCRLSARLGDTDWIITPFVEVLAHHPPGYAVLVDPDHHLGALLPAEMLAVMRTALRQSEHTGSIIPEI